jgi:hypothetical protein
MQAVNINGSAITAFPKLVGRDPTCGESRKVLEMFFNYIKIEKFIRNGKVKK